MFFKKKRKIKGPDIGRNISLTDYLSDALLVFDSKNRLVLANRKAKEMFGIKEDNVLGKPVLELSRFEKLLPVINALGGELKIAEKEPVTIAKNFIVEVTTVPVLINKARANTLAIIHDVTGEKLSDQMKSEFVTLAAHQLRTPTSGIKWSLQALLEGDLGPLNDQQKEIVKTANETNNRVIGLVNDLLNLAQIEEGKYLRNRALNNIEDIIESILERNRQRIIKKKIYVQFNKVNAPKILMDKERIDIALTNIIDNAIRYTASGGKILIDILASSQEVEVRIKDTGMGIAKGDQSRVFSKFFRAKNAMKVETEGSGLGLYMGKNIIEAHGGKIWFNSEIEKGTVFHVIIPIKKKFGEFIPSSLY